MSYWVLWVYVFGTIMKPNEWFHLWKLFEPQYGYVTSKQISYQYVKGDPELATQITMD